MATEALTPQQTFENKVKDRLREAIGDLMPDELLRDLIQRAMTEMFFTSKEKKAQSSWDKTIISPSWFEEEVEKLLKERILKEVREIIATRKEEIAQKLTESIKASFPELLAKVFVDVIAGAGSTLAFNFQQEIASKIQGR